MKSMQLYLLLILSLFPACSTPQKSGIEATAVCIEEKLPEFVRVLNDLEEKLMAKDLLLPTSKASYSELLNNLQSGTLILAESEFASAPDQQILNSPSNFITMLGCFSSYNTTDASAEGDTRFFTVLEKMAAENDLGPSLTAELLGTLENGDVSESAYKYVLNYLAWYNIHNKGNHPLSTAALYPRALSTKWEVKKGILF